LLVDPLSEAFITVNHEPLPEPSVHGGGSSPVLEPEVAPVNELPTQAAAPSYIAVPPCGLVLFCAEAAVATSIQSINNTQMFFIVSPFWGLNFVPSPCKGLTFLVGLEEGS
jgi:hypothetical protein